MKKIIRISGLSVITISLSILLFVNCKKNESELTKNPVQKDQVNSSQNGNLIASGKGTINVSCPECRIFVYNDGNPYCIGNDGNCRSHLKGRGPGIII